MVNSNQPVQSVQPYNPFASWRFWLAMVAIVPLYAVWLFVHFPSFAIVNGTIAGLGPILIGLFVGIRQRDWRFIALAIGYAAFVYWTLRDLISN